MSSALPRIRTLRTAYPDAVEFGLVYLVLAVLPLWRAVVTRLIYRTSGVLPSSLSDFQPAYASLVWFCLGMGLLALAYARLHGTGLALSPPRLDSLDAVALAVGGSVAVTAGVAAVAHLALDTTVSGIVGTRYHPELSVRPLVVIGLLPALAAGTGYALLFCGAIQERLRDRFGPAEAVVAVTVLGGLYRWFATPSTSFGPRLAVLLFVTALVVACGYLTLSLRRVDADGSVWDALTPARAVALALAGLLAFGVAVDVLSGATGAGDLLEDTAWLAAFAVAALAHERSRSVWVPALALGLFEFGRQVVPYAEAVAGLTPVP